MLRARGDRSSFAAACRAYCLVFWRRPAMPSMLQLHHRPFYAACMRC
jgi:hypothetical protein